MPEIMTQRHKVDKIFFNSRTYFRDLSCMILTFWHTLQFSDRQNFHPSIFSSLNELKVKNQNKTKSKLQCQTCLTGLRIDKTAEWYYFHFFQSNSLRLRTQVKSNCPLKTDGNSQTCFPEYLQRKQSYFFKVFLYISIQQLEFKLN